MAYGDGFLVMSTRAKMSAIPNLSLTTWMCWTVELVTTGGRRLVRRLTSKTGSFTVVVSSQFLSSLWLFKRWVSWLFRNCQRGVIGGCRYLGAFLGTYWMTYRQQGQGGLQWLHGPRDVSHCRLCLSSSQAPHCWSVLVCVPLTKLPLLLCSVVRALCLGISASTELANSNMWRQARLLRTMLVP